MIELKDLSRKNYSQKFFWYSRTAEREKITNVPPASARVGLMVLANMLQNITDKTGFVIKASNVFRCHQLNRVIGGSTTSAHCQGLAVDIIAVELTAEEKLKNPNKKIPKTLEEIADLIFSADIVFDQLLMEKDKGCVHLGFRLNDKDNRLEVAYAYFKDGVWKKDVISSKKLLLEKANLKKLN